MCSHSAKTRKQSSRSSKRALTDSPCALSWLATCFVWLPLMRLGVASLPLHAGAKCESTVALSLVAGGAWTGADVRKCCRVRSADMMAWLQQRPGLHTERQGRT